MIASLKKILTALKFSFSYKSGYNLENRIFILIVFISGTALFFNNLISYFIVGYDTLFFLATTVLSALYLAFYFLSIKTGRFEIYKYLFVFTTFLLIPFFWFMFYGIAGPVPYFFILIHIVLIIILKKIPKRIFLTIFTIQIIAISIVEYYNPDLSEIYNTREEYFIDNIFTLIMVLVTISILIGIVMKNYIKEKETAIEKSKDLQEALEEITEINENLTQTNNDLQEAHNVMQRDMKMAINVQKSFYKLDIPGNLDWDYAYTFKPAAGISGDLYDFYFDSNKLKGFTLCDVSGHGIASGLVAVVAKRIIFKHFTIDKKIKISDVLTEINREIIHEIGESGYYITGILLRIDESLIEYAIAGHEDILIKRKPNNNSVVIEDLKSTSGSFLGIKQLQANYKNNQTTIDKGNILCIFSDGLTENRNNENEMYTLERLKETYLKIPYEFSAQEHLDLIIEDLNNFSKSEKLQDDLTLIILKKY